MQFEEGRDYVGTVTSRAEIFWTRKGSRASRLEFWIEELGERITAYNNDDPEDLQFFSFEVGDQANIRLKDNKGFTQVTVRTPTGTVEDPGKNLLEALSGEQMPVEIPEDADPTPLESLMDFYTDCRLTAVRQSKFMDSLRQCTGEDPAAMEGSIRTATASLFITGLQRGYYRD